MSAGLELGLGQTSARLRATLVDVPGLLMAELIGSLASQTAHADSDVDLLLVVDVAEEDLFSWRRASLQDVYALEDELGREVHATVFSRARFLAEAARPSGFLTTVCARPHHPLVGSLTQALPEASMSLLQERALAFLTRLEDEGELTEAYRQGLSVLRGSR